MPRALAILLALLLLPSLAWGIVPTMHAAAVLARNQAACPLPSLAYWKFNEVATTTTAADSVGANTGTLTNMAGTEWEAGHLNNALRFDGTNDYVDAGDINAIDTATDLSVCTWVFHDVLTSDDAIVSKASSGLTSGFLLQRDDVGFVSGRTDTYLINIQDTADTDSAIIEGATNASVATTETLVCFTLTLNAANGLRLYVDGVEDANSPVSTVGISNIGNAEEVRIGSSADAGRDFDGRIDNVVVHEGLWTAADILALYNGGTGCESN